MQNEDVIEKPERTTENNKISEGAMVTAEDGQEFHTGTRHSIISTAGKFLSKWFMDNSALK